MKYQEVCFDNSGVSGVTDIYFEMYQEILPVILSEIMVVLMVFKKTLTSVHS